jgi:hypothetical protein
MVTFRVRQRNRLVRLQMRQCEHYAREPMSEGKSSQAERRAHVDSGVGGEVSGFSGGAGVAGMRLNIEAAADSLTFTRCRPFRFGEFRKPVS